MRSTRYAFLFLLAALTAVGLAACDFSEQNYEIEPGNSLDIEGARSVTIPNSDTSATAEYFVRAFTIEKNYTWTVNGESPSNVRRQGEYIDVVYDEPGTYTIIVDDGEEYADTATVEADYPGLGEQASAQGYSIFVDAVNRVELESVPEEGPLTVFAPTDTAFVTALDTSGNGSVEPEEFPADSVLAETLLYHIVPDRLESSELTDGTTAATVLGPELSFEGVGGTVVVNDTAEVVAADDATNRGLLHGIDALLTPPDN